MEEEEKDEARQAAANLELRPTEVGKETLVVAGIVLQKARERERDLGRLGN